MRQLTFSDMERWNLTQLREKRLELRNALAEEIHKRDALKAEILFLQKEILSYRTET